jgi:hypothetical protein
MRGSGAIRAQEDTEERVYLPSPFGINTIDPAVALPAGDALYLFNVIAAELGLRSRLGYKEWVTGLGAPVRTTLPFVGSKSNGSTNALFGITSAGIYDCTLSTDTPGAPLVAFGITSGDAGWGTGFNIRNLSGKYLAYTDEENGLFYYPENSPTWLQPVLGVAAVWVQSFNYLVGDQVVNGSDIYICTQDGLSSSSGSGPSGTGTAITDGTVLWDYVSPQLANVIGPSIADQRAGRSPDPEKLVHVTVWGNRVWFTERDTTRAWYGILDGVFGEFTSFDFGGRFRLGGALVGLFSWSYDGGRNDLSTKLVAISTSGDIVIYGGSDPSSIDTFAIQGVWSVGGVPAGRSIATDFGGDMLILSLQGVVPLSRLITGANRFNPEQYETYKVGNIFNLLSSEFGQFRGWNVVLHPTDNTLLVTIPQGVDIATTQLAMSLQKKSWSRYRDLPILSCSPWNGVLHFGTSDGRVCRNEGYVDNVLLSDPNAFTPVAWSLLDRYNNLGNGNQKIVHRIIPQISSGQTTPLVQAKALYNLSLLEPPPPAGSSLSGGGEWDQAVWDQAVWGGDQTPYMPIQGAFGMGREVAIAVRGTAISRTTYVGSYVYFEMGWGL